jgi:hypothetical protein
MVSNYTGINFDFNMAEFKNFFYEYLGNYRPKENPLWCLPLFMDLAIG